MRFGWKIVAAVLALLVLRTAAQAAESAWVTNDQGEVRLISAVTATGDSDHVQLGLEFHLKPGWKIYWRSPGDAGYPPSIDWKGSDNLFEPYLSWPAPHRFSVSGLETLGYKDEVVLPIVVRLTEPSLPLSLRAGVDYLTCDVLCIPQHADLALDLPAGPAEASTQAHLISRYIARVPGEGARVGLQVVSVEGTEAGELKVVVKADPPLVKPDLFIERADQMQFTPPKLRLEKGGKRVMFELKSVENTGEGDLFDKPLTLTMVDGDRGMETVVDVAHVQPGSRIGKLLAMLGVALLGGFILNLMPCVLPVLSIKVLSLIGHGGAERRHIRAGFLASAGGIVASFLALALAAVAVKAAGSAVGWGIQFQQPLFLVMMVVILVLFAANLFGFYEIALPRWAADAGVGHGNPQSLLGHFAAGVFATLLATPCSAPFLGTAIGFALARGPLEIVGIFAALGLGMALPYLAVAAWPQLAQRLPRPGRWMIGARRILGLVLVLTAAWMLAVLAAVAGARAGMTVGALMVAALMVLAVRNRLAGVVRVVVLVLLAVGSVVISSGSLPLLSASATPEALKGLWVPFDRDAIPRLVGEGKVVFVDVTAEWCITCQVNKATVVYRGAVAKRLAAPGVVAMQADWTRPDEAISAYLASFGRYGIPFNAVYGPGAPDGIPLPELLSEDAVVEALDKAAAAPPITAVK
jgi:suppressor for copper-sensitivity B